jgi:hypothetical protein
MSGVYVIWLAFALKRWVDFLFDNSANSDVSGGFSAGANHFNIFIAMTIIGIGVLIFFAKKIFPINKYVKVQAMYFLYIGLSSMASESILISYGQLLYSIYALIYSVLICVALLDFNARDRVKYFFFIWGGILWINYFMKLAYNIEKFPLAALDEAALLSFVVYVGVISTNVKSSLASYSILLLPLGSSFTAIAVATVGCVFYSRIFLDRITSLIIAAVSILLFSIFLYLALNDQITVYGKTSDYFYTGSGRFYVWESIWDAIENGSFFGLLFGNGYMSERNLLSKLDLPWVIDAHSNILQIIYGSGVVGLVFAINIWMYPLRSAFKNLINGSGFNYRYVSGSNIMLFLFGLSSSHYFSRPSLSAIFITSLVGVIFLNSQKQGYSLNGAFNSFKK